MKAFYLRQWTKLAHDHTFGTVCFSLCKRGASPVAQDARCHAGRAHIQKVPVA